MPKKALVLLILFVLTVFSLPQKASANFDKINTENNKFGIHLAVTTEEELEDAAALVNSSGGDWGYVTVVIEKNDRDKNRWQTVFNKMRELHLIPIVRLATIFENGSWQKPNVDEAGQWAEFLNSLHWPVKNRYVVLFNEPNHATEWGGKVDPEDYGKVSLEYAKKINEKNGDFFVMLAGFDAAAPHKMPQYEDEEKFLEKMFSSLPNSGEELRNNLEGWASHSYPNHGFVGTPYEHGRNSIKTYLWELNLLKKYNFKDDLPIFITETGWPHAEGLNLKSGFYNQQKVEQYFISYFNELNKDERVVAITPFVLNYQGAPFDHFSWRKLGGDKEFYPQYQAVQTISKPKGQPKQDQRLVILNNLPQKLTEESTYQIPLKIRNEGQALWDLKDGYELAILNNNDFEYFTSDLFNLEPFKEETIWLHFKTKDNLSKFDLQLAVTKENKVISNVHTWSFVTLPAPNLDFNVTLFPKIKAEGNNFKLLIYDDNEKVVFEKENIEVSSGKGHIDRINNLAFGEKYRLVLLKPYYLPRQEISTLKEGRNEVNFGRLLPADFNLDGHFSAKDIFTAFLKQKLRSLYWPF